MKKGSSTTAAYPILSKTKLVFVSAISSLLVGSTVLLSQWLIYDDWLHRSGPLRIIGTIASALLTYFFVHRWQSLQRERQIEIVKRFERIAFMNDRIRNSLQAIECVTFVAQPQATEAVRDAVNAIDTVLGEVLAEMNPAEILRQSEAQATSRSVTAGNS